MSAPTQIIDWTQIASNFVASMAGGGVAAFATWLAVGRQMRLQQQVLQRSALEFFEFLFGEQSKTIQKIVNEKATKDIVWLADLDRLGVTYQLFERNRESLIHIPDRGMRDRIVDLLSEIQVWQTITRNAVSTQITANRHASDASLSADERGRATVEAKQQQENVNAWFSDVVGQLNRCVVIAQEIRELPRG